MTLVETVACKFLPIAVNGLGNFLRYSILYCASNKLISMLFNLFFFLLRNGFAQFIRLGGCIPGKFHRGTHQLFLINRDAISILEDRLQGGMTIFHFRFAM